ncbi:hypothetical protein AAG570_007996 [Ranatra chinensis]|uniref:Uncharacterized protein n=1 Tax=Ranatra chinensis TaxID=642074 RepID=A0ABD0XTN0_9HEMI
MFNYDCRDDVSTSGCSLHDKRRIDSMFEEHRSAVSNSTGRKSSSISINSISEEKNKFSVDYIGSTPVGTQVTSLGSLQRPLKRLWLQGNRGRSSDRPVGNSILEITQAGLNVTGPEGSRAYPFSAIVVWAALKLTGKCTPEGIRYAFLPPAADRWAPDRSGLFWRARARDVALPAALEPPLLALVTGGRGGRLHCHCFLTDSPREAVVAAASLYAALVRWVPPQPPPPPPPPAQSARTPWRLRRDSGGDVLTRVAIPRSRCFLRTGSGRADLLANAISVSTPDDASGDGLLGLDRLFREFRRQEGLYDIDEILNNIINSEGMSFNDLRPIYKEFVLKLALLLTKDELYRRSESIMRRQRRTRNRLKLKNGRKSKAFTVGGNFKRALKKSVSGLRSSKRARDCIEFTSVLLPSCGEANNAPLGYRGRTRCDTPAASGRIGNFVKISLRRIMAPKFKNRADAVQRPDKEDGTSKLILNAESGDSPITPPDYQSCSECGYDSETCTCASAEKCYCSLGKSERTHRPPDSAWSQLNERDLTARDGSFFRRSTDDRPSAFEQLKMCGFAVSESSHSRSVSPQRDFEGHETGRERGDRFSKPRKLGIGSSTSLEFVRMGYTEEKLSKSYLDLGHRQKKTDKLAERGLGIGMNPPPCDSAHSRKDNPHGSAVHCQLMDGGGGFGSCKSRGDKEKKILVVSARDPSGKVVYMGATGRKPKTNGDQCAQADEALSVKKLAEIASLFCQTRKGEIYDTLGRNEYLNISEVKDNFTDANLENSLGYFP